jgi:hypothetical protein
MQLLGICTATSTLLPGKLTADPSAQLPTTCTQLGGHTSSDTPCRRHTQADATADKTQPVSALASVWILTEQLVLLGG